MAELLEFLGACPIRSFLFHLAVWIATTLQGLQRLLQRLRHFPVIDHATPQIHDLVDVLHQQRAFLFTSPTGRARPDFIR
jgi:hypothetical protein